MPIDIGELSISSAYCSSEDSIVRRLKGWWNLGVFLFYLENLQWCRQCVCWVYWTKSHLPLVLLWKTRRIAEKIKQIRVQSYFRKFSSTLLDYVDIRINWSILVTYSHYGAIGDPIYLFVWCSSSCIFALSWNRTSIRGYNQQISSKPSVVLDSWN